MTPATWPKNYTPCNSEYKKADGTLGYRTESSGFTLDMRTAYTQGNSWVLGFEQYLELGFKRGISIN